MWRFADGFTFGVSTSAYQCEGAADADGKGRSIWDDFVRQPRRIVDGSTGDVSCAHVQHLEEDLDLLVELGVGAYRFSTAWTRLLPDGRGKLRRDGLDLYERLVDGLLDRGIEPWLCLYHWDLPSALASGGGWAARDTAHYFADYASLVAEHLGDRVERFFMLNEPNTHALLGHLLGVHAPGSTDLASFGAAVHHQNLATGLALVRVREIAPRATLGTIVNLQPVLAAGEAEEDAHAAALFDAVWNRASLEPLLLGAYPEVAAPLFSSWVRDDDMSVIQQPLDVLGVNYYTRLRVRASATSLVGMEIAEAPAGTEVTAMAWEVAPEALTALLVDLKDRYACPPIVITECGAAYVDPVAGPDGIDDARRARFHVQHLAAVAKALQAGCDVRGYFAWTLVDNFEWADGFTKPFGLVAFDHDTLERSPKRSFATYQKLVNARAVEI